MIAAGDGGADFASHGAQGAKGSLPQLWVEGAYPQVCTNLQGEAKMQQKGVPGNRLGEVAMITGDAHGYDRASVRGSLPTLLEQRGGATVGQEVEVAEEISHRPRERVALQ